MDGVFRTLAVAALACSAAMAAENTADPVVAERGAVQITASRARAMVAGADPDSRRRLAADPAALRAFLRDALLQQAVLVEASARNWDRRPDVAAALQRAHDQIVAASYLTAQAPLPAGYPPDAAVETAYAQNKAQLMQPRTYHLTQIFVPAASAYGAEGRRRLTELHARLQHGHPPPDAPEQFEKAAGSVPDARYNDLGFLAEPALVPAVRSAVAGLQEGAVGDPVCTPGGCSLLRLAATRPAGPAPLPEVRDQIVRALRQQKMAADEQAYAGALLQREPVRVNEIELARLGTAGAR